MICRKFRKQYDLAPGPLAGWCRERWIRSPAFTGQGQGLGVGVTVAPCFTSDGNEYPLVHPYASVYVA